LFQRRNVQVDACEIVQHNLGWSAALQFVECLEIAATPVTDIDGPGRSGLFRQKRSKFFMIAVAAKATK
jgi:hypothetical protein